MTDASGEGGSCLGWRLLLLESELAAACVEGSATASTCNSRWQGSGVIGVCEHSMQQPCRLSMYQAVSRCGCCRWCVPGLHGNESL